MEIAVLICNNKLDYDMAIKAYSMYKYLRKQGNQVEIIDYNLINKNNKDKSTKMLYDFLDKNIVLTLKKYNTTCQLEENLPLADKYLIVNGTYNDLSINFGKNKVAYYTKGMTSFELDKFKNEYIDISLCYELNDYKRVIDPLFLLSQNEWYEIFKTDANISLPTNYILVFSKNVTKDMIQYCDILSRYNGTKLYYITEKMDAIFYNGKRLKNINPVDLANLIANADDIVTSENIAIKLAILFEKNMHIFTNGEDSQLKLINDIKLNDRIVKSSISILSNVNDYKESYSIIDELKNNSYEFLKR